MSVPKRLRALFAALLLMAVPSALAQPPGETGPFDQFAVFPQVVVGGGFSGEVFLVNQGYVFIEELKLQFFDNLGEPMPVETEVGVVVEREFGLQPGHSISIRLRPADDQLSVGYAQLTFPAEASIRGTLTLRAEDDEGNLITQLGIPSDVPFNNFTFLGEVNEERQINTGLAMVNGSFLLTEPLNPTPRDQSIIIDLFNLDGTPRATTTIPLPLNQHRAAFLSEIFPGLGDFIGTVSVSAGIDFGLLPLRQERGVLSTLATDIGPNFSSFDFSAELTEVPEVEPNGVRSNAMALPELPARIGGVVSVQSETDLFRIEATQGQVLTAYTLTFESELDSFLALESDTGELLAFSDQNGLLRRDDSFLRLVIPEDGVYFLRVEDFFFSGGLLFPYSFLVRLDPSPGERILDP